MRLAIRKCLAGVALATAVAVPVLADSAAAAPAKVAAPAYCEVKHGQIINRPAPDVGICYGTIFVRGYNIPWW